MCSTVTACGAAANRAITAGVVTLVPWARAIPSWTRSSNTAITSSAWGVCAPVELDYVHPVCVEASEAGDDGGPQVGRLDAGAAARAAVLVEQQSHLGGHHHLVPAAGHGLADVPLSGAASVRVGGVDQSEAQVKTGAEGGDRILLADRGPARRATLERPSTPKRPGAHA